VELTIFLGKSQRFQKHNETIKKIKIGRVASEKITRQLIKISCLPVLIVCGLETRLLNNSDLRSLDFVINRFFTKLFATASIETVNCQEYFGFALPPSALWAKRVSKFELSFESGLIYF